MAETGRFFLAPRCVTSDNMAQAPSLDGDPWTAEYRASRLSRLASGAKDLARAGARQGARAAGRISNVLAPETTRWGVAFWQEQLGRMSPIGRVKYDTVGPLRTTL